jgi:hypothetical protein
VWADRCQALKCEPDQPGTSLLLTEESYPLPFRGVEGAGMVPVIVFAIATHMMLHPASDLLQVLSGENTCRRTAVCGCRLRGVKQFDMLNDS